MSNILKLFAVVIAGASSLCFPSISLAQEHDYVFEGSLTYDDIGQYLYFDFDVPQGTTKLYFSFSYQSSSADESGLDNSDDKQFSDVLTVAVFDSNGFRGSGLKGGGNFTIALSEEHTSNGYMPGEIPAGTWKVEIGVGFVMKGHTVNYAGTIDLSTEDVGETFVPPEYEDVVLSNEARWYKGDLHCHSTHSDGSHPMADVFEYAHSRGLDFLALTDHNTLSHQVHIPEYQEAYPDMLLLYGWEVTSFRGHFNVFNFTEYVDYQATMAGYDINAVFDEVHAKGGYVSPNHPVNPTIQTPAADYYGLAWGFPETDWSKVDFIEAINGPMVVFGFIPNVFNGLAIEMWDDIQDAGYSVSIRGGSDDHSAGQGTGETYCPIGCPTTVVYAEELSANAIMEALKAGHAFLIAASPDEPEIYLEAKSGDKTAIVGDTIEGNVIEVSVKVLRGSGTILTLEMDGKKMTGYSNIPVDSDDFKFEFEVKPQKPSRLRAELRNSSKILQAITNSLFIEPEPEDEADDDTDDDSGGDEGCGCGL